MADLTPSNDTTREQCAFCETTRPHHVAIELLAESDKATNQKFSREPYRVAECTICGTTTQLRLNDA